MADSPEAFAAKLGAVVAGVHAVEPATIRQGATIIQGSVFTAMAATGLGSRRLRNAGRGGARLNVRSKMVSFGGSPGAIVRASGPWQLVEEATSAHRIEPRSEDVLALKIGSEFAANANHPGTRRGKHAWRIGAEAARKPVAVAYQKEMAKVITTLF